MGFKMSVFIGLLGLILGTQCIILLIEYKVNKSYKDISEILIGSALVSLSYILAAIIKGESLVKLIAIVKPIMILGYIFLYVGIRRYSKRTSNKWPSVCIFIVINVFFYYYYIFIENTSVQIAIISLVIGLTLFKIIHEILFKKDKSLSLYTNFIAIIFFIYGSIKIIRGFRMMIQSPISPYIDTVYTLILALTFALIIISDLWALGLIIMTNYKLIKEKHLKMEKVVQELEEERDKAQKDSITDGLTGLYNRRYFDSMLKTEFFRLMRSESELSLIMLDIDHFKEFNDTYGHLAGDKCLQKISNMLKRTVERAPDIIARYGGEEFILILPETNEKGAKLLGERIRKGVEDLAIPHRRSETSPYVTVSVGVITICPRNLTNPEEALKMVDEALYKAKRKGRNRCVYRS